MKYYHNKVRSFFPTSIRCNHDSQFRLSEILNTCAVEGFHCSDFCQPFLKNIFGAVKTIMSNEENCLRIHYADAATGTDTVVFSALAYCFIITFRTGTRNIC